MLDMLAILLRKVKVYVKRYRTFVLVLYMVSVCFMFCADYLEASEFEDLPVVKRIEILGNKTFSDGMLKKMMRLKEAHFYNIFTKPRFRRDYLRRDIETIKSFYRKNGFFDAVVRVEYVKRDRKKNSVVVRIFINEGPQTRVQKVTFGGRYLLSEEELRKGLKLVEYKPYNPNLLESDRYTIFSKFLRRGYLSASVSYRVKVDSLDVSIAWYIEPGEPIRINNHMIEGNEKVASHLIERELTFRRGEVFNLDKVLESKQNLYDTGFFNSVDIEPESLDTSRRLVDLLISVRERKTGYIEAGLGVGNIHGNRLFAEWGHRNVFGRGIALRFKTSYAFSVFQDNKFSLKRMDYRDRFTSHDGEIRVPHIFSTWNTLTLGAYYERDATVEPIVVRSVSFKAMVSRRFTRQTSLLIGYGLEQIKRFEVKEEKEESRKHSMNVSFTQDTRDYYFNPSRGKYITLEGKVSGGLFGGEENVYSLALSYQRYMRVGRKSVLAYRIRSGYADVFGESKDYMVPVESRFFAGGANSVRGYRENSLGLLRDGDEPVGGRVLLLTNLELRCPFPYLGKYNFGCAIFIDGGNVWQSVKEISIRDFRFFADRQDLTYRDYMYSVGFGLRYYTPVGPFRIDVGFPIKRPTTVDYDYWLHISLGQIF